MKIVRVEDPMHAVRSSEMYEIYYADRAIDGYLKSIVVLLLRESDDVKCGIWPISGGSGGFLGLLV